MDLILNTVSDILAGNDDDEAVGDGTVAVGRTSESEPGGSFAAASSSPPGISSYLELPACTCRRAVRRGSTCHSRLRSARAGLTDRQVERRLAG